MSTKKTITFRQWLYLCWMNWVIGWAELIDGLVRIVTFGFVSVDFSYRMVLRKIHTRSGWKIEGNMTPKVRGW